MINRPVLAGQNSFLNGQLQILGHNKEETNKGLD